MPLWGLDCAGTWIQPGEVGGPASGQRSPPRFDTKDLGVVVEKGNQLG